jgi:Na+-driven multidrug efflux pump
MHLMLAYAAVVGVVIIAFDTALIAAFLDSQAVDQDRIISLASQLLVIAALWGVGDAINLTCTHALNGVGDTRWTLVANAITGVLVLALPTLLVLYRYEQGTMPGEPVVVLWSITLAFIAVIAAVTAWRFAGRRWEDSTVRA